MARRQEELVNALAEAARLLGDIELTLGQLAQLRALDRKYAQRRYEGGTEEELLAALRSDILEMLTPEQGRSLRRR
jgi:hypothetical protein